MLHTITFYIFRKQAKQNYSNVFEVTEPVPLPSFATESKACWNSNKPVHACQLAYQKRKISNLNFQDAPDVYWMLLLNNNLSVIILLFKSNQDRIIILNCSNLNTTQYCSCHSCKTEWHFTLCCYPKYLNKSKQVISFLIGKEMHRVCEVTNFIYCCLHPHWSQWSKWHALHTKSNAY